jgi:hypothetical protein
VSPKERLGIYERKQQKIWFNEECLYFLGQSKQAKMQWLQDPNRSNVDNPNNARLQASRYFRKKIMDIRKLKLMNLKKTKNKNIRDLYRDINYSKKGYQPRTIIVQTRMMTS